MLEIARGQRPLLHRLVMFHCAAALGPEEGPRLGAIPSHHGNDMQKHGGRQQIYSTVARTCLWESAIFLTRLSWAGYIASLRVYIAGFCRRKMLDDFGELQAACAC